MNQNSRKMRNEWHFFMYLCFYALFYALLRMGEAKCIADDYKIEYKYNKKRSNFTIERTCH